MYAGVPTTTPICVNMRVSVTGIGRHGTERLGNAEVGDQRMSILQHDVLGLDVAVHNAVTVRVIECARHLHRQSHGMIDG